MSSRVEGPCVFFSTNPKRLPHPRRVLCDRVGTPLSCHCHVIDPVLRPARLIILGAERLFLSVTDRFQPVRRNALLFQHLLHRFCRLVPSARLYSSEPRSSQCPSSVTLIIGC